MWPYPNIIAHRGGGNRAPENTLAAMRCGLAHGFHAVEFDVMLAGDGVPVVVHDPQFGRTVPGSGRVCDTPSAALAGMDAGSWFGAEFAGEPVPTYEQVAGFCIEHAIWMNVEIKPAPGFDQETGRVVGELTRHLFAARIAAHVPGGNDATLPLFSSFSFEAVMAARAAAPEIPRGWLTTAIPADWRQKLEQLDAVALHTDHAKLSAAQARAIKQAGYGLMCYTVNDIERAREIMAWGVDAFCTDRIDLFRPDFS